jgi:hypothetical protein
MKRNKITTISPGKQRINVAIELQHETPKIAAGKTISSSGFIAPRGGRKLQSGNYKGKKPIPYV